MCLHAPSLILSFVSHRRIILQGDADEGRKKPEERNRNVRGSEVRKKKKKKRMRRKEKMMKMMNWKY